MELLKAGSISQISKHADANADTIEYIGFAMTSTCTLHARTEAGSSVDIPPETIVVYVFRSEPSYKKDDAERFNRIDLYYVTDQVYRFQDCTFSTVIGAAKFWGLKLDE